VLGDKQEHFEGKGTEISALVTHVEEYLKNNGFTVQTSPPSDKGTVIQAKKGGFLREVVAADRALSITITGNPNDFTVRFGIGKWLEHLGVAAIETLLLSELFLVVDVADSLWSLEVEDKLIANVKAFVG
jgi:predicted ATPase